MVVGLSHIHKECTLVSTDCSAYRCLKSHLMNASRMLELESATKLHFCTKYQLLIHFSEHHSTLILITQLFVLLLRYFPLNWNSEFISAQNSRK